MINFERRAHRSDAHDRHSGNRFSANGSRATSAISNPVPVMVRVYGSGERLFVIHRQRLTGGIGHRMRSKPGSVNTNRIVNLVALR